MARSVFGGGAQDFAFATVSAAGYSLMKTLPSYAVTFWSAKTGGTQYTDLLLGADGSGGAATSVTTDSRGLLPEFQGPDGVTLMWADAGSTRVKVTQADLSATYVPQVNPSTVNERIASRYQPVFDASFVFSKISSVQDGLLVWSNMNVSAGAATPTYFKAVGGSITHSGPGNLDVFWASVTHTGAREAGLFIGDITSSGGGNNYGIHTRNIQNTLAPSDILVGYECELQPNVARGTAKYYNILMQNSGSQPVSAGIQIESPATGGGGKFDKGINFDASAADVSATGIFMGGVWGAGIDMNNNALVGIGSLSGQGSAGSRFVRVADFLTLDNTRNIGFKDTGGTHRKVLSVSGSDSTQFFLAKSAGQFEFRDFGDTTNLARITSSGRAEFAAGGVTTKYTSGATQPAFLTNGQVEVWHDTGGGLDYLVVNVNGVSKKVQVT
jgi:hypothetical protein